MLELPFRAPAEVDDEEDEDRLAAVPCDARSPRAACLRVIRVFLFFAVVDYLLLLVCLYVADLLVLRVALAFLVKEDNPRRPRLATVRGKMVEASSNPSNVGISVLFYVLSSTFSFSSPYYYYYYYY